MASRPKKGPYPESYVPSDKGSSEWHDYTKPTEIVTVDKPKVDLVFVHGLGSRWQQTWCGPDGSSWLEDLLPGELPPSRILVSGFNGLSRIDGTLSSFTDGCDRLMHDLKAVRKDDNRPLVFIAHSIGGLIIQQALSKLSAGPLRDSIKGIIFFGTPNFGSDHEAWRLFRKQMAKMIEGTHKDIQESSLTRLGNINTGFDEWLSKQLFSHHVYRFYEGLPVYRLGYIVSKDNCYEKRELPDHSVISSDHLGMVKFDDPADVAYQIVLKKLKIIISYRDGSAESSFSTQTVTFSAPGRATTNASQISCPDAREFILASDNVNVKLALALEDQGQYAAAEEAYREAIAELIETLGEQERLTLYCMEKLASILRDRSHYNEAAKLSKKVLMARIEQHGLDSSATLTSVGNLALIMRYQSKQQEAYSMIRNALEHNESRPLDSITRTRVVSVLAKIFRDHGAYDTSVLFSRDVARASSWWLGTNHPFTLNRLSDLTVAYSTSNFTNNYLVAEDLGRQVLDSLEKALGRDHPNALRTARRVGNYQRFQGDVGGAFKRLENVWFREKEQLGPSHPQTLSTMTALASVSALKGYLGDAQTALEEAIHEQTELLGVNHQNTLWTAEALKQLENVKINPHNKSHTDVDPKICNFFRSPSSIKQTVSLDPVPVFWASSQPESSLIQAINTGTFPDVETALDGITDNGMLGRALRVASYLGKESFVRLLLERGAPVNSSGGYYGTALQAASQAGHLSIVHLLLEMNADVNQQAGLLNTALRAAVFKGHEKIVDVLLNSGANSNLHSECSTVLQVAVSKRDIPTVKKLLNSQADPNAADQLFGTPLQEAAFLGATDIVELLISYGADPNLPGGLYGSAMQAALRTSHRETVKYLMEHGADASSYNMLNAIMESGMDLVDVSFGRHTSDLFVMEPQFGPKANVSKLSFGFRKRWGRTETVEFRRKEDFSARAKTPPGKGGHEAIRDKSASRERSATRDKSQARRLSKHLKILGR